MGVWEVTPRTVLTDATSSSPIARSCLLRGRDDQLVWTQPLSPWPRGWWSPQNHRTDHRAAGCVCRDCHTNTQYVYVREEEWAVVYREVVDGIASKTHAHLFCAHIRWKSRCEKGMCSADPECTQHSSIPNSEASVLFDLTTKSARIGG